MTKVCILGATGSIGRQALEVCREMGYVVAGVTANTDFEGLVEICREFRPEFAAIADETRLSDFKAIAGKTKVFGGSTGILECIRESRADITLNSIVGSAGILPTLEAVRRSKRVALANKESLVAAGKIIMEEVKSRGTELIPVDSEHSAIFQCLEGNRSNRLKTIYLTASGGPFRGFDREQLKNVTREMALAHPNWVMGSKITIDSATMMNKGLEVIEARWLFDCIYEDIKVVVHPESIVHSMVEFDDGSIIAQLGAPDMRVPIQFSMTYPKRMCNSFNKLDIYKMRKLEFTEPDTDSFKCLALAYEAGKRGGTMPCVMNAANEEAVAAFLRDIIPFVRIDEIIRRVMEQHVSFEPDSVETILEQDRIARFLARKIIKED